MLSPELLKKAKQIHIRSRRLVDTAMVGSYHSSFRGKGMEFQEVRQYHPGDDVRDIDWNVTARLGEPYIKVFQEERELTVMLLIDMSASGWIGSHGQLKQDFIAEVAAIIAYSAIKNNDNVGVILFTDQIESYIPPKKGRGHVWRVIRDILQAEKSRRKTDLMHALQFLNRVMKQRGVCFLISDFIDDRDYSQPLQMAARKHDLLGLVVRDRIETQMPDVGILMLEDPESGQQIIFDSHSPRNRRTLQQLVENENQRVQKMLRRAGADGWFVNSDGDSLKQLAGYFRSRRYR